MEGLLYILQEINKLIVPFVHSTYTIGVVGILLSIVFFICLPFYYLFNTRNQHKRVRLIILDMNKLLVFRAFQPKLKEEFPQITNSMLLDAELLGKHYTWLRPGTRKFLDQLFANYQVAVWSSAMPQNVALLCSHVFGDVRRAELVFEWSQEQCEVVDPHPDPTERKPLFTKPLSKVVAAFSHSPQQYKMEEILMIDDSLLKMTDNPRGSYLLTKEWTPVDKEEETLEDVWRRIESHGPHAP